jgi:CheY-like chemotaxis protein
MGGKTKGAFWGRPLPEESADGAFLRGPIYRVTRSATAPRSGTIVIADYDRDNLAVLSYAFKGAGVKNSIHWIQNSDALMEYLEAGKPIAGSVLQQKPLLLLLDWNIPDGGAVEVLKRVRRQPEYADLLVAVITGSNEPGQKRAAYETGANWHFEKSSDFADLMRLVRHIREFWSYAVEPGFYEQLAARQ